METFLCRIKIECAFGRLKSRFTALQRKIDLTFLDLQYMIFSCFVLHILRELHNEKLRDSDVAIVIQQDKAEQPIVSENNATTTLLPPPLRRPESTAFRYPVFILFTLLIMLSFVKALWLAELGDSSLLTPLSLDILL